MDLRVTIVEVRGSCPVYRKGDVFYLEEGYILETARSCRICMHSLASILPYYTSISRGVEPVELGLASERGQAGRVQCLDPCEYTGGGTVIMEVVKIENGGK